MRTRVIGHLEAFPRLESHCPLVTQIDLSLRVSDGIRACRANAAFAALSTTATVVGRFGLRGSVLIRTTRNASISIRPGRASCWRRRSWTCLKAGPLDTRNLPRHQEAPVGAAPKVAALSCARRPGCCAETDGPPVSKGSAAVFRNYPGS